MNRIHDAGIIHACYVLVESTVAGSTLLKALAPWKPIAFPARTEPPPLYSNGGVVIKNPTRPDMKIQVDLLECPWPDNLGQPPEQDDEVQDAHLVGMFGPGIFPGALLRAREQANPALLPRVDRHRACLRIRATHAPQPSRPGRYDQAYRCEDFVDCLRIAEALLALEQALCYFNPAGEVLAAATEVRDSLACYDDGGPFPINLVSVVRVLSVPDSDRCFIMDTVGQHQLGTFDHELLFQTATAETAVNESFIRNVTLYCMNSGQSIQTGDTTTAADGTVWTASHKEESLAFPPRPVIQWQPTGDQQVPPGPK